MKSDADNSAECLLHTHLDGGGALLWGSFAGVRPARPPGPTTETLPGLLLALCSTVQRLVHLKPTTFVSLHRQDKVLWRSTTTTYTSSVKRLYLSALVEVVPLQVAVLAGVASVSEPVDDVRPRQAALVSHLVVFLGRRPLRADEGLLQDVKLLWCLLHRLPANGWSVLPLLSRGRRHRPWFHLLAISLDFLVLWRHFPPLSEPGIHLPSRQLRLCTQPAQLLVRRRVWLLEAGLEDEQLLRSLFLELLWREVGKGVAEFHPPVAGGPWRARGVGRSWGGVACIITGVDDDGGRGNFAVVAVIKAPAAAAVPSSASSGRCGSAGRGFAQQDAMVILWVPLVVARVAEPLLYCSLGEFGDLHESWYLCLCGELSPAVARLQLRQLLLRLLRFGSRRVQTERRAGRHLSLWFWRRRLGGFGLVSRDACDRQGDGRGDRHGAAVTGHLSEDESRLADDLARLEYGLQAVGGSGDVGRDDGDGLRDGLHRAIKLLPPRLLHLRRRGTVDC